MQRPWGRMVLGMLEEQWLEERQATCRGLGEGVCILYSVMRNCGEAVAQGEEHRPDLYLERSLAPQIMKMKSDRATRVRCVRDGSLGSLGPVNITLSPHQPWVAANSLGKSIF